MMDSANVVMTQLSLKTLNLDRSDVVFAGGTLTLTDANPLRGGNFPSQNVDITAGAGDFQIVHSATPQEDKSLATKVGSDLFSIDGTEIVVDADGSNVSALNAELATKVVNGKWLQITGTDNGPQTLNVVPEPATLGMVALVGGLAVFIRRRFMC